MLQISFGNILKATTTNKSALYDFSFSKNTSSFKDSGESTSIPNSNPFSFTSVGIIFLPLPFSLSVALTIETISILLLYRNSRLVAAKNGVPKNTIFISN